MKDKQPRSSASLNPQLNKSRAPAKAASKLKNSPSKNAGASFSQDKFSDRFSAWLQNHQLVAVETLERLLLSPASSLLTWLVVAIALTLPGLLYMTVVNMQQLTGHLQDSGQVTVFLQSEVSPQQLETLQQQIKQQDFIASSQYVSAEQALEEFKAYSGMQQELVQALDYLSENPLPAVILVEPKIGTDQQQLLTWQQQMQTQPAVASVQADMAWLARLQGILQLLSRIISLLAMLLASAIVLLIGNTIRLAIAAREDEIRVVKLVGGSEAFVRRPFLYTGFWYGFGGALLASLLLFVLWLMMRGPVAELAMLYSAQFELLSFGFVPSLLMILAAVLLGLLGAWWSVQRHLALIEP